MNYPDIFELSKKVVVITGAASGIGLESAKAFAACGASLVLIDFNQSSLESLKETLLNQYSITISTYAVDVTNEAAIVDCAQNAMSTFGQIDVLVNSAGIALLHSAADISSEDWNKVLDVNINGTFWACRAFAAQMMKQGGGSIINLGSMSGNVINQPQFASSYMVSKAAVHQLTKALAVEWAQQGIRVNALAPGYVATDMTLEMRAQPELFYKWLEMTPLGRLGSPSEIAAMILFLGSDASTYLTGSVVAIDGGYTCL
ncbi:SDR family NAD(P)-dependent oxidoreductase [Marinomonas sp.]|uniref:SDR family NAD(P)-dependent oxidoreductase n=1 Tax=Marinomonas sp. TaxID=1904862 RepID=UPI003A932191